MTVKELRYLVDNLDEYIHVPGGIERLKKTVLHLAVSGQLVPQDASEGTGEELYQQIQAEKTKLISEGKLKKQKPLPEITDSEIPFQIPKTWKWARLGEIVYLKSGADLKPNQYNAESDGVPYITGASNLLNGRIIINRWTPAPKNIAERGDLLLTCKGTIGAMAFLYEDKVHIARQIMAIRFTQLQNPSFVRTIIETRLQDLQSLAQSIIPGIAREDVLGMVVALPPLVEQKRIVEKVDAIFALIDELAEKYKAEQAEREKLVASSLVRLARGDGNLALAHLGEIIRTKDDAAQLRKTILHLAVSGQFVPQYPSEGTGEELYQQIQSEKARLISEGKLKKQKPLPEITEDETPFKIPKTWKWARLGDVLRKITDGSHNPPKGAEAGLAMLSSRNITAAGLDFSNIRLLTPQDFEKENERTRIERGDILLTIVGSIGRTYVVDERDERFTLQRSVAVLGPLLLSARYLSSAVFASPYFQATLEDEATGTAQRGVYLNQLKQIIVPLPPLTEQTRIVQKTTQLLDLVTQLEHQLRR